MTTEIIAELNELRNQVRTLKRMLFGVFGLVVVGGLLAATSLQSVPDVIRAKKVEVVNDAGEVLISLNGVMQEIGIITAHEYRATDPDDLDEDGNERLVVSMGAYEAGGVINLVSNKDKNRSIGVGIFPHTHQGGVAVMDNSRLPVLMMGASADGKGFLELNPAVEDLNDHFRKPED